MLKNRKKANAVKLSGIALLAVAVAGIGGTGAVIQHKLALKNIVKTPTVEVSIGDEVGAIKGSKKQKEVSFKNEGTADVFIRVAYAEQWKQGEELLSSQDSEGKDVVKKFDGAEQLDDSMASIFSGNLWTLGPDGWYYYNHVLKAGTSTGKLLTAVDFSDFASQDQGMAESLKKYENADYELHFQVEAVQASDDYTLNQEAINEVFGSEVELGTQPSDWATNKYGSQIEWVEGGN